MQIYHSLWRGFVARNSMCRLRDNLEYIGSRIGPNAIAFRSESPVTKLFSQAIRARCPSFSRLIVRSLKPGGTRTKKLVLISHCQAARFHLKMFSPSLLSPRRQQLFSKPRKVWCDLSGTRKSLCLPHYKQTKIQTNFQKQCSSLFPSEGYLQSRGTFVRNY